MKKEEKDPKVVIFGEEVTEEKNRQCRHHDGGSLWGVFVMFLGILFLLNTLNVLPWSIWDQLVRFWPVLLILGGFHIILGNSLLSRLILTIISLIIFGTVLLIILRAFAPQLLIGLPANVLYYIDTLNGYFYKL